MKMICYKNCNFMGFINQLFVKFTMGNQPKKVDALHYFITEVSAGKKKRALGMIIKQVNKDQRAIVEQGRKLSVIKS